MQFEARGCDAVFTLERERRVGGRIRDLSEVPGEVAASPFPGCAAEDVRTLYKLETPVLGGDLLRAGQGFRSVCQVVQ